MKTLVLNRDSWHYWLAKKFKWEECEHIYNHDLGRYEFVQKDFCSYVRRIFFGLMAVTLIFLGTLIAFFGIVLLPQWHFFYWIYLCIKAGKFVAFVKDVTDLAGIAIIEWIIATGIFLRISYVKGWWHWPSWRLPRLKLPPCEEIPYCEDTKRFLVAVYEVFHDKVCFKLDFREKE